MSEQEQKADVSVTAVVAPGASVAQNLRGSGKKRGEKKPTIAPFRIKVEEKPFKKEASAVFTLVILLLVYHKKSLI